MYILCCSYFSCVTKYKMEDAGTQNFQDNSNENGDLSDGERVYMSTTSAGNIIYMDQSRGMLENAVALFLKIVTVFHKNSCMVVICIVTFSEDNTVFSTFFSKK